jgi:hypothetical protein
MATKVYQNGSDGVEPIEIKGVKRDSPLGKIDPQEADMFAQHISVVLKPHCVVEFTRTIKNQVIPLLRKQEGFQDQITFVVSDGPEALEITLWDQQENAAAYYRTTYPQVQELLAGVVEATPEVKNYEVTNSTHHKIAARAAASS